MGSAGGALSSPPGRPARLPAMIALWPVSGSIRSSGERRGASSPAAAGERPGSGLTWGLALRARSGELLLHRDVLDPGLPECAPPRLISGAFIERSRVRLRVEHDPPSTGGASLRVRGFEQRRGDALAPRRGPDSQPAELNRAADEDKPAGAEQLAGGGFAGLVDGTVELLTLGHTLFQTEDLVAKLQSLRELTPGMRSTNHEPDRGAHLEGSLPEQPFSPPTR